MRQATLPISLLAITLGVVGCRDACEQRCFAVKDFYEACEEELEQADFPMPCYDEGVEAYPDGTVDREHRRECDDGRDAHQSCLRVSHARAEAMSVENNNSRLEECEEGDEFDVAVDALDCESAIDALDEQTRY